MYEIVLFIHSWCRWLVTFALVLVFLCALKGWIQNKEFTKFDKISGITLIGATHLQFLIGLFLYFALSPITNAAMTNMGAAMKNTTLRFWGVEHIATMIIFLILVQTGYSLAKRTNNIRKKHKYLAIFSGIAIIILCAGMPWSSRKEIGRPLFMDFPNKGQVTSDS